MNKLRFNFFTALFLLGLFSLYSCQEDVTEVLDPPQDEVITTSSPIFDLLGRTTEFDGSFDNILDGSSCTSLVLPVTVVISGIEIFIDSEEDLSVIEEIFDEFDNDLDDLDFIFPVTVILSDHSEIVIENEDQLEDIIEDCVEGGNDDDIECLDFQYPITISVFDTASNVAETFVLDSDEELHSLLEDLDFDDLITLQYPITIELYDSTTVVVNNNHELEDLIEQVKDACDEDDDNDYNDDDADDSEFVEILLDGKWIVDEFFLRDDKTELFAGYFFKFKEDGKVWAYNDVWEVAGEWETDGDDGYIELELEFSDESIFEKISDDWMVLEYNVDHIKLFNDDYDYDVAQDSVAYLSFERYEGEDPGHTDTLFVGPVIIDGAWIVAHYEMTGNTETEAFNDFIIEFDENGGIIAERGNDIFDGSWEEFTTNEGQILYLEFGDSGLFSQLSEEWTVLEIREDRIELKVWKDEQQYEILVLERLE